MVRSSLVTTAAGERSRRSSGFYSVFYGVIPHFRPETLKKWMNSVTLCQATADL